MLHILRIICVLRIVMLSILFLRSCKKRMGLLKGDGFWLLCMGEKLAIVSQF